MIVDDDANLLDNFQRLLKKLFDVDTFLNGKDGLAALAEKGQYPVIISDLRMPGMDGFEFLSRARKASPDSALIMLTGYADLDTSMKAVNEGAVFRFLTKPCKTHILIKSISAGIEQFAKNTQQSQMDTGQLETRSKKKILIVDQDPEILTVLSTALKMKKEFDVVTAENGSVALELLKIIKIDMVVTDNYMPEMNGLELMDHINKRHPEMPVDMMGWHIDDDLKKRIEKFGGPQFFEKPLKTDVLTEVIKEELFSGPRGKIDGISIPTCLQMIETEEKTCTLKVKSRDNSGLLYFRKGALVAAETGELESEAAACAIISWEKASIEIEDGCRQKENLINRPLMSILIESSIIKDKTGHHALR